MSEANATQVGGSHYKQNGRPEHWDLVVMFQWDYFQSQITKYLMRWKTKHPTKEKKLEDLKKARHFLDKYIEEYEKFLLVEPVMPVDLRPPGLRTPEEADQLIRKIGNALGAPTLAEYEKASSVYLSNHLFLHEGGWGDGTNLYTCKGCGDKVHARSLMEAEVKHGACGGPTRAYVNQG